MPEPILLLNRRSRRHHAKNRKRRKYSRNRSRSRSRRRNRRMPAGLRRYWASRRGHRKNRAYRRRRRAVRTNRRVHRYARHHRTNRRYRRNRRTFRARGMRGLTHWIGPVVTGAAGGVVLDLAWGALSKRVTFLANYQTGWGAFAAKLGVLVGLGYVLNRWVLKNPGQKAIVRRGVLGGATVITYGALRGLTQQFLPNAPLAGYMDFHSYAVPGLRGYMPRSAAPMLGSLEDLYSPAAVIQPPGTAVPRQFGGYIAAQPGGMSGYMQPHMMGGGLGGYDWTHDGM